MRLERFDERDDRGWKFTPNLMEQAKAELENVFSEVIVRDLTPGVFTEKLKQVCDAVFPKRVFCRTHRKGKYWWNNVIADKRKQCNECRRKLMGTRKRGTREDVVRCLVKYRLSRRSLKKIY